MTAGLPKSDAALPPAPCCGRCTHFRNAPADLEAAFPGRSAMSSGHASVRAHDGLCDSHGVYLSFRDCCAEFAAAEPP